MSGELFPLIGLLALPLGDAQDVGGEARALTRFPRITLCGVAFDLNGILQ
jgi:hypothetical protein